MWMFWLTCLAIIHRVACWHVFTKCAFRRFKYISFKMLKKLNSYSVSRVIFWCYCLSPTVSTLNLFFLSSYAELIADWPVVVLGVCTVLIVVCALVGILVPDLPDFSDPLRVSTDPNDFCFQSKSSTLVCLKDTFKPQVLVWAGIMQIQRSSNQNRDQSNMWVSPKTLMGACQMYKFSSSLTLCWGLQVNYDC